MSPASPPNTDELIRIAHVAAKRGDRGALDQLVKACYSDVWRLCAVLVDEQSADDLAQETFVRMTKALRRYRGEASPRTWILSIARHICMDELRVRHRRRGRERQLLSTAERAGHGTDPAEDVAANELLRHLDPNRRAAFVLTQLLRLSYNEAAIVCGCPPGTIRSRVARARDDLIALLTSDQVAADASGHGSGTRSPSDNR